jgi:hypothetical protein
MDVGESSSEIVANWQVVQVCRQSQGLEVDSCHTFPKRVTALFLARAVRAFFPAHSQCPGTMLVDEVDFHALMVRVPEAQQAAL